MAQTPVPGQIIKYVGRTTDFKGKTLWEIVGNLKNHGVGRIVVRNMFQRYKEPCFMKIIKVDGAPNEDVRKVKVFVEKVFRGIRSPEPVVISRTSYKADYLLIPKDKEKEYESLTEVSDVVNKKVMPRETEFPPLLKRFLAKETGNPDVKLELIYSSARENYYRVAEKGEKPTTEFESELGKPVSPNLYKNIKVS